MKTIQFNIECTPVPKGRPRFAKRGNFVSTYTPTKTKTYEEMIAAHARQEMGSGSPLETPLTASISFYMPIPASYSKARRKACIEGKEKHTKKPDLDNLVKAVLDAMNNIVYLDDSQIVHLMLHKHYSDQPSISVSITECLE